MRTICVITNTPPAGCPFLKPSRSRQVTSRFSFGLVAIRPLVPAALCSLLLVGCGTDASTSPSDTTVDASGDVVVDAPGDVAMDGRADVSVDVQDSGIDSSDAGDSAVDASDASDDGGDASDSSPDAPVDAGTGPTLTAPKDGDASIFPHRYFYWEPVAGSSAYVIQIASDQSFTDVVDQDTMATTRYVNESSFDTHSFWWRVAALDDQGVRGPWSKSRSFSVTPPAHTYHVPDGASLTQARSIIDEAIAHSPSAVYFASDGKYVWGPEAKKECLRLASAHDVLIDGFRSKVTITTPTAGFVSLFNSDSVKISSFHVDYNPLPFTQGVVVAVNQTAKSFDYRLDSGYPDLNAPHMTDPSVGRWGALMDRTVPGRLKTDAYNVFWTQDAPAKVGNRTYRMVLAPQSASNIGQFEVGDVYVKLARAHRLLGATSSSRVVFSWITANASPGGFFVGALDTELAVLDSGVRIAPGRHMASDADGVHCQNFRVGPWVEKCSFEGLMDDSMNIYSAPLYVAKQKSATELTLRPAGRAKLTKVGDRLAFFDGVSGQAPQTAVITQSSIVGNDWNVKVATPLTNLSLGSDKSNTTVFNLDRSGNGFVIRHNQFRNSRRYGILLKSFNGLIDGNRFEGLSSSSITLHNEPSWPEGLNSEHVLIRDNTIQHCGFDTNDLNKRFGSIETFIDKLPYAQAPWRGQRDIEIRDNVITDWEGTAINIGNGSGVTVTGNTIGNSPQTTAFMRPDNVAIEVSNSENVQGHNHVTDTRPLSESVRVTDSDNVHVQ